ncbi:NtaA/DmoA family FMN-dependent monooxygenase [Paracoccus methylarcula]|uniref:LLM class flavin-dependent oxidoreductase n=1 Tax=Paracoccus methylarcula TaxID=72022 RepID=A0A422QZH3_9RHOB|nr:NtaA/DmoA family FMN-dependent monooxygenase [Paracoccus methylarcula]RNF35303.1 LLM class flavin-dependent oxidoreductase [Paracoccus methylarcula]
MGRKLKIGISLAPTWHSGEGWRRPDSGIENIYSADFFADIARRGEAAHLDFAFLPDVQMLNRPALESGGGFASLDPTMLLASIAGRTSAIGLLTTASTTFRTPYTVARQLQSLHWLSRGRAGWNIVTALDGNGNFGLSEMPPAAERYERAAEFTQVVRELWDSFPAEALLRDREKGRFADPALTRPIDHRGRYFSVDGPLNLPRFDGPPIPLFQAGASPEGRQFAASVAQGIFASTPDMEVAAELRRDLRHRAEGVGREPNDIRLMPGFSLWLAPTRAEAQELFAFTHSRTDPARKIATILEATGLDLTGWPEDRRIRAADLPEPPASPRSRTHAGLLRRAILRDEPTRAQLLARPEVVGSAHWRVIGTIGDAVDEIRNWVDAGAIDGFIATPGGSPACLDMVLEELAPALADLGLFRKKYSGDSFWHHLHEI